MRKAVDALGAGSGLPESFWYSVKRRLLGPPLVSEALGEQRLSNPLALGVLSPDGVSSSAYGTEQMLTELLPFFGLAAFTLVLPVTLAILFVMTLVVLCYRQVVMVYVRPGGSYVVARQNFGPRVAQVCAVALLIDYVVTVAVQTSAGTAAIVSIPAFSFLGPYSQEITIGVILIMCYGNLRGLKEAGRSFAIPTYLFSGSVMLMIAVGLIRQLTTGLPKYQPYSLPHSILPHAAGHGTSGLISFAVVLTVLRSFANGGSSLTGIEAVSDAVGAFRPPESINARRVLAAEGVILGILVAGVSWFAFTTHATPRTTGYPTVLAQEAQQVFGTSILGHLLFYLVQAASALILYTGANTSFNGFPFLSSYVAGDAFLPRWLLKRGHRLVFSNAIVVLTVASVALIIIRGANVSNLVPLYAIGVFTAFSMAGFGMARYHSRRREQGWRRRMVLNASAGGLSLIVVAIFAIVKFTEGAWIVVVLFAVLVPALIRLNREYRMEADVLAAITGRQPPPQPTYARRTVLVFVDSFDLATIAALRYARSLRPTSLRAVHFVIDSVKADMLRRDWTRGNRGVVLEFVDVPDRRLTRAAADLVGSEVEDPNTHVTVILPRRSYSALLGRLLHDRTADKIAAVVSRIPRSAATIVPYDVQSRVRMVQERQAARAARADGGRLAGPPGPATAPAAAPAAPAGQENPSDQEMRSVRRLRDLVKGRDERETPPAAGGMAAYERPAPSAGVKPIGSLRGPGKATVEGRVRALEIRPVEQNSVLACEISDSTGDLTAMFYGRSHIAGVICGSLVRLRGPVGMRDGHPVMVNPAYELVAREEEAGQ